MTTNKKPTPKKIKKTKTENIYSINNQEFRFPSIIDRIVALFK